MESFNFFTVKSVFHGGGIHSRHKTLERALEEQRRWTVSPGLAIAERGSDGRLYMTDYDELGNVVWQSDRPIPTVSERANPSARDYLVSDRDVLTPVNA